MELNSSSDEGEGRQKKGTKKRGARFTDDVGVRSGNEIDKTTKKKKKKKKKKDKSASASGSSRVTRGIRQRPIVVHYEKIVDPKYVPGKKQRAGQKVSPRLSEQDYRVLDKNNELKLTVGNLFTQDIKGAIESELMDVDEEDPDPDAPLGYEASPNSLEQGPYFMRKNPQAGRNLNKRKTDELQGVKNSEEWWAAVPAVSKWVHTLPRGYDETKLQVTDRGHYVVDIVIICKPIKVPGAGDDDEVVSQKSQSSQLSRRSSASKSSRPRSIRKAPIKIPRYLLVKFAGPFSNNKEEGTYTADSKNEIDPSYFIWLPNKLVPETDDSVSDFTHVLF